MLNGDADSVPRIAYAISENAHIQRLRDPVRGDSLFRNFQPVYIASRCSTVIVLR